MAEFIYTMRKARKAHGDKVILDDVTLSFLPGAKIGVAPLEDFSYTIAALVLLPSLWSLLTPRRAEVTA